MYVTCKGSFLTYPDTNVFYLQVNVPTYTLMYLPVCECFPGQNGALRDAAAGRPSTACCAAVCRASAS